MKTLLLSILAIVILSTSTISNAHASEHVEMAKVMIIETMQMTGAKRETFEDLVIFKVAKWHGYNRDTQYQIAVTLGLAEQILNPDAAVYINAAGEDVARAIGKNVKFLD